MDPCYTSQSYASTYEHYFMPMIDKRSWPQYTGFELRHDPDQIRGKGRPKSKRIANEIDEGRKKRNSCRRFGSEGQRTCNSR